METLVIKGAPTFNTLLNPIPYGAAINSDIAPPNSSSSKIADRDDIDAGIEEESNKLKRRNVQVQFEEEFTKRQKVIKTAVPTIDNSPEWTKTYKKITDVMKEKEWSEKILREWGGKFPEIERLDVEMLKIVENKIWDILSMAHPFEGQWELCKMGMHGLEKIALSYGLKQYQGVTEVLSKDHVLYLEAKKYSYKYFDYGTSMHWFQLLGRIYKDISEVAVGNLRQAELAHQLLSLPATQEALRLYKEYN
jgi:hypothetical protein